MDNLNFVRLLKAPYQYTQLICSDSLFAVNKNSLKWPKICLKSLAATEITLQAILILRKMLLDMGILKKILISLLRTICFCILST